MSFRWWHSYLLRLSGASQHLHLLEIWEWWRWPKLFNCQMLHLSRYLWPFPFEVQLELFGLTRKRHSIPITLVGNVEWENHAVSFVLHEARVARGTNITLYLCTFCFAFWHGKTVGLVMNSLPIDKSDCIVCPVIYVRIGMMHFAYLLGSYYFDPVTNTAYFSVLAASLHVFLLSYSRSCCLFYFSDRTRHSHDRVPTTNSKLSTWCSSFSRSCRSNRHKHSFITPAASSYHFLQALGPLWRALELLPASHLSSWQERSGCVMEQCWALLSGICQFRY